MFCPYCNAEHEGTIRVQQETYPVKGENVTITARVRVCNACGNELWDDQLDSKNLKAAFAIYRNRHGLLHPEQIQKIRMKYSLSQVAFARVLGLGDKTITRYENGSLPDAAQNNLIKLMTDPWNFKELLDANKEKLSASDRGSAERALNVLTQPDIVPLPSCGSMSYSTTPSMSFRSEKYA